MKQIVIFATVLGMLLALPIGARAEAGHCFCPEHLDGSAVYTPGDVDKDGAVTVLDALWILKMATRLNSRFRSGELCCAPEVSDVTGDDRIDASDALAVLKFSVGKIDRFARQPILPAPAETPTDWF